MEAIKKKVQNLKTEKDNASDKADANEATAREAEVRLGKGQEEVQQCTKKLQQIEGEFATSQVNLNEANAKLAATEEKFKTAENDIFSLSKKVQIIEDNFETTEEKFKTASASLIVAIHSRDEADRMGKVMANRTATDGERMDNLEAQLKEATGQAEDADRKYEEVAKKLAQVETDTEMAEDRAASGVSKIIELEEELKVVVNNLTSLKVSVDKAAKSEANYQIIVKNLSAKMKQAEARAEFAEKTVLKLQREVQRVEDETLNEQEKFKAITAELDQTYSEMTGY